MPTLAPSGRGGAIKTYRVVLDGRALSGFAADEVRQRLAALIGRSEEAAAKLLCGTPTTVKKGVDEATGQRYVERLRKIGVSCRLEPEAPERDLNPAPSVAPVMTPTVRKQVQRWSKRDLSYSLIATLVIAAYLLPSLATQFLLGAVKREDLPLFVAIAFVACAIVFAVVYLISGKIRGKSSAQREYDSAYKPSRLLIIVAVILVALTGTYSVVTSVSIGQRAVDTANKQMEAAKATAAATKRSADLQDAEKAERAAKFAAERPGIISKAKSLLAQHKWEELARMDYDYGWAHDAELNKLTDTARGKLYEISQAKDRIEQAKERAERKKQGASIGMTKEEVLMSSWGKPDSVNRTVTPYGIHEQWVYRSRGEGYLYFEGDVLTAIQN